MPWLVKFPGRQEHREVCVIEACYARLARECGLDMPRTRYFDLGPRHAAFGIERFDRRNGMRVPMHTLAGALHAHFRLPGVSYQALLRATRLFIPIPIHNVPDETDGFFCQARRVRRQ